MARPISMYSGPVPIIRAFANQLGETFRTWAAWSVDSSESRDIVSDILLLRWSEQSLKRTKRNERPPADADHLQLALFDETPDGRVAETADLSSCSNRDRERLLVESLHANILGPY
jgi:hypothetical protein